MRTIVALFASLLAGVATAADPSASQRLNKLFDDYFERSLQMNPLQATFIGDDRYDDKLTNSIAPEFIRMALDVERSYLEAALKFDPKTLSAEDRLSWEIFVHERRVAVDGARFPGELLPIDQLFSLPTLMPVLASASSAQPFREAKDYERFLARMNWVSASLVAEPTGSKVANFLLGTPAQRMGKAVAIYVFPALALDAAVSTQPAAAETRQ
jgi:uncharacterized protein (DUF885 family)